MKSNMLVNYVFSIIQNKKLRERNLNFAAYIQENERQMNK